MDFKTNSLRAFEIFSDMAGQAVLYKIFKIKTVWSARGTCDFNSALISVHAFSIILC
jgi:hypothetical protein